MPDGSIRTIPSIALFRAEAPEPVQCTICTVWVTARPVCTGEFSGRRLYRWQYCSCMAEAVAEYQRQQQQADHTVTDRLHREAFARDQEAYWQIFPQWRQSRKVPRQTFATFRRTNHNQQALDVAQRWATEITTPGLFFTGPSGTGKSHLMRAILHQMLAQERHILYTSVPFLLERLRPDQRPDAPTMDRILQLHTTADCVAWDDLGVEKPTEWTHERLYLLVDALYEAEKPLLITSNFAPEALTDRIGSRVMSRLLEMTAVWAMDGPDARLDTARKRVRKGVVAHG